MPERIQLSRGKGWRLPPGARSVARPSPWGNPYTVAGAIEVGYATDKPQGQKVAVEFFRSWLLGTGESNDTYAVGSRTYDRRWMRDHLPDLTGKTIACWCAPGDPCHGDVLKSIANGEDEIGRVVMCLLHPDRLPGWWAYA